MIRASGLRFAPDAGGTSFRTEFTIVARIRDSRVETVKKSSQPYRLTGPIGTVDQARAGQVLFFRQPELEPGAYTLEVAVHDALAQRAGGHRSSFVVSGEAQLPRAGSPPADESGQIRRLIQVPVETLSAGRYTLRLTVEQGGREVVREVAFTLVDR
jgi:hypothetical protein